MRFDSIASYIYRADEYAPEEIVARVYRDRGIEGHGLSSDPEEALDLIARSEGIDRMNKRSFDSDDFPKIVFADGSTPL